MFGHFFWKSTAERAVKSFSQSLLGLLSAGSVGLLEVDWVTALSTAAMVTLLSVLSSVASAGTGAAGDPSLLPSHDARPAPSTSAGAATIVP